MAATADSNEMAAKGIDERYFSRAHHRRRGRRTPARPPLPHEERLPPTTLERIGGSLFLFVRLGGRLGGEGLGAYVRRDRLILIGLSNFVKQDFMSHNSLGSNNSS